MSQNPELERNRLNKVSMITLLFFITAAFGSQKLRLPQLFFFREVSTGASKETAAAMSPFDWRVEKYFQRTKVVVNVCATQHHHACVTIFFRQPKIRGSTFPNWTEAKTRHKTAGRPNKQVNTATDLARRVCAWVTFTRRRERNIWLAGSECVLKFNSLHNKRTHAHTHTKYLSAIITRRRHQQRHSVIHCHRISE